MERVILNANQLRRLAEWADGVRGLVLQLVPDESGGQMVVVNDVNSVSANAVLVSTGLRNPNRTLPFRVDVLKSKDAVAHSLDPLIFDAVFWSEPAFEKFLLLYYARFYTDAQMDELKAAFVQGDVLAIAHIYPTYWERLKNTFYVLPGPGNLIERSFIPASEWLRLRR